MSRYDSDEEHQPITWLRGYPVYAAHFIVLVFVGSMLVSTVLMAGNVGHLLSWLTFRSDEVLKGEVWRLFSYGFVNPPSLWFVIDMVMIVCFGREVERFLGRRTFLLLYGCIYFLSPLLLTLIGMWQPMQLAGAPGAFALFIAFATIYPNAVLLFNFLAKWVAAILVGIDTLIALSVHDWAGLISLWATVGFAFAFVRHHQGHFALPSFSLLRRRPPHRPRPDPSPARTAVMTEVDTLLDKISRSGFSSLTPEERAKLDAARKQLRQRASGHR